MEEIGWRSAAETSTIAPQLEHLRQQIDVIDEQLAMLLKRRLLIGETVGKLKASKGVPVKDETREQRVLDKVRETVGDDRIATAACEIYRTILEESCKLQVPQLEKERLASGPIYFNEIAIIGVGLIGGALARQIKKRMPSAKIIGCDSQVVLADALAAGAIDSAETDAVAAVRRANLVLLCAAPDENLNLLREIAAHTKSRQVIVDTTSSKTTICKEAENLQLNADFIGGHPFFGSEKSGFQASAALHIEGKPFCLVPTSRSSELSIKRLAKWLSDLGMSVTISGAETHDESVSDTSHLVQLVAVAVGCALTADRTDGQLKQVLQLSGPSLRAHSRLMSSPSKMWTQIFFSNKQALLRSVQKLVRELQDFESALVAEDAEDIAARFSKAASVPLALPPQKISSTDQNVQ